MKSVSWNFFIFYFWMLHSKVEILLKVNKWWILNIYYIVVFCTRMTVSMNYFLIVYNPRAPHRAPHEINCVINKNEKITSSKCSCTAGLSGRCKHTAGVLVFCNRWLLFGFIFINKKNFFFIYISFGNFNCNLSNWLYLIFYIF